MLTTASNHKRRAHSSSSHVGKSLMMNGGDDSRRETPLRILHLEDNLTDAELIAATLATEGVQCAFHRVDTEAAFCAALAQPLDLIISDFTLPTFDGFQALQIARRERPEVPFIFISGTIGEEIAVDSLRAGAVDYVIKDRLQRLVPAVRRAVREAKERAALRRIEQLARLQSTALESVANGILISDVKGDILWVNPAFTALTGYTTAEAVGQNPRILKSGAHPPEFYREMWQTISAGRLWRGEVINRRKDGSLYTAELTITPMLNGHGEVTHFVAAKQDITARKQAEARIAEQAALLDNASDGIIVQGLDHAILYWNQGAERLYGWTANEARGRRVSDLICASPASFAAIHQAVLARGSWSGELKQRTKAGKELIVFNRWSLVRDEQGSPKTLFVINTDISEKKQLEAQFLRSQRLENIGALASGIAHDLNNILAPVLMVSDILRAELASDSSRQLLDTVTASAMRGADLVKQVLSFARGVSGDPVALNVGFLTKDMVHLARDTFPRSIDIRAHVDGDLQTVRGDATQVHQVLLNLCINARDAMPEGGKLLLEAANINLAQKAVPGRLEPVTGPFVRLQVTDTGIGIPPEILDRIFEPFFTTKATGKGTGLGLSTVASIVRNHGGFCEVASRVGKGTTFSVYLPAADETNPQAPASRPLNPPMGNGEQILLVDDDQAILEMLKEILEAYHYRVLVAANGNVALSLYQQHHRDISVIVTDLMMPVMDGLGLIMAARQVNPTAKIVCISGLAADASLVSANRRHVSAVLIKPFAGRELLETLHQCLTAG